MYYAWQTVTNEFSPNCSCAHGLFFLVCKPSWTDPVGKSQSSRCATLRSEFNTHMHARMYTHSGAQTVWKDGMYECGEDDGSDPPLASTRVMQRARSPPPPTTLPPFYFLHCTHSFSHFTSLYLSLCSQ